jgi:omega-6 fatty acid desaturase (delta-12 desaturase)
MLGFFVSTSLWAGGIWLISISPHWGLWIPAALISGLGGWGLHCIAHDCGHGSFSRSKGFNYFIGQLSLIPLLYPFHGWRHVHNLHHANTNHLEKDTDWRPLIRPVYQRMPLVGRAIYRGTRSLFFWLGTAHYQLISGFNPNLFPSASARADVRRSMLFVAVVAGVVFPAVYLASGPMGMVKYLLLPWLGIHAWFSTTTLMHHTSEDLPFLQGKHWNKQASKLLLTTDYTHSKLLHFLTHNITVHTAHHVAPKIPFYNLIKARNQLEEDFPGMIRKRPFTWGALFRAVRKCHLYDTRTGFYESFGAGGSSTGASQGRAVEGVRA